MLAADPADGREADRVVELREPAGLNAEAGRNSRDLPGKGGRRAGVPRAAVSGAHSPETDNSDY